MKKNNLKNGISLIVLVITIIVLAILASAVLISISNSNIMTKAKESTFKSDMRQFQEAYGIWYASTAAENKALPGLTINAEYDLDPNSLYQEIFGSSVPTQYREGLKVEDGRVVYYTTDADRKVLLAELGMSPNALKITNTLTNCINSNSTENIEYGEKYEGVLTPAPGYTIQNVCITMGGVDITSTAYTVATGAISISNVTGKIIINATTEPGTYTVNNSLTHASTNNSNTQATGATSYSAVLSPNAGYTLTGATVTITMGGVDITSTAYTAATGAISISSVTGNVVISASMPAATYTVTNNLTGCTSSNAATSAIGATSYTATLTANTGKQLSSVTVTMGGVDVTSTYYNTSTHVVSIVSVTGDIVITATTSDITYTVTYTLTDVTKSSGSTSVNYGASLSATVAASSGYSLPDSITVTIGGSNYTGFTYTKATGSISIPTNAITGNVVITVTGEVDLIPTYDGSWIASKGVNSPKLGTGMTGVYWDTNGNEVTVTDSNYSNWYDYSSQKWANAKTADGSYWVWIPRYAYKFESGLGTSTAGTISVKFLQGKTDKDSTNATISKTYPTITNNAMDAYVVHPAFIDDSASTYMHGGWDAELSGIWVAKYEMSNDGSNNLLSVPGVSSWRSISISDMYTKCQNYIPSMQSHLMKNSEWGAVAYLAQSSFGRNGVEVTINSNSSFYTGGSQNATANTNPLQSTTGNNTGIFDMSGGSWEYVAGYITNGNETIAPYGSSFASTTANATGYQTLSTKFVTVYPYNSSSDGNTNNYTAYKNVGYGYGDAILETSTAGAGTTSWFSDYSYFAYGDGPFFVRGGTYVVGTNAGLFSFDYSSGSASTNSSFRSVCVGLQPPHPSSLLASPR